MTPDKHFKMDRTIKTYLAAAVCEDTHRYLAALKKGRHPEPMKDLAGIKKTMIDAQLREESAKREALKSKDVGARESGTGITGEAKGRTKNSRSSVDSE